MPVCVFTSRRGLLYNGGVADLLTIQIREVNRAISELVGGAQSATVSAGGATKSYTRPDLGKLMEWRDRLMREAAAGTNRKRMGADFS